MSFPPFIDWLVYNHLLRFVWIHGYLFYALCYPSILLVFAHHFLPLAIGSSFSQLWRPCDIPPSSWGFLFLVCLLVSEHLLLSGTTWCYRVMLYTSCPNASINHSSKEPWFLSLEGGLRSPDLCMKYACYYWCVGASRPSQLIEQGDMIYTSA